jgi:hypothetical protein
MAADTCATLAGALSVIRSLCVIVLVLAVTPSRLEAHADGSARVVFVANASVGGAAGLETAIRAQLAGSGAEVTFDEFETPTATLREQAEQARLLARRHGATGVFWLEVAPDGGWLLYLTEPEGERILVRRLDVTTEASGVEAVGIVTAHSATALLAGETIGMVPVDSGPPRTQPAPETPKPPRAGPVRAEGDRSVHGPAVRPIPQASPSGLEIAVGYRGSSYADALPYQHGLVALGLWGLSGGPYFGAGLSVTEVSHVDDALVDVELARRGGQVLVGHRVWSGPLALSIDVGYQADLVSRRAEPASETIRTSPPSHRLQSSLGFSMKALWALTPMLGVFAGPGAQVVLNHFESIALVDGQQIVVLSPHPVRLTFDVGVVVWP